MIVLLSVRLLDDRFHGHTSNGEKAEWPPSPFRLFQAIVAGNAQGETLPPELINALEWLESLDPPEIIVPSTQPCSVLRTYVLNNSGTRSRAQKFIRPTFLNNDRLIEFAWHFDPKDVDSYRHSETLVSAIRHIRAFGWGIDLAIGNGEVMQSLSEKSASRLRFSPAEDFNALGIDIRCPRPGSLASLRDCYVQYLGRFESDNSTLLESSGPIYQVRTYAIKQPRPHAVFKLLDGNDDTYSCAQSKLIHIAGMVRHVAIERMKRNPPNELRDYSLEDWIRTYVAGHQSYEDKVANNPHSQFSFVPLPSIGHEHTDPSIRRIMVVTPYGDEAWLNHLVEQLDGELLTPLPDTIIPPGTRIELVHPHTKDGVRDAYTRASLTWASVTPVILPGHDDHNPRKTQKLIEIAMAQSGVDRSCKFEWNVFSQFPRSLSARKYDRRKRLTGYIRPKHLLNYSAVHLMLRFDDGLKVHGPLVIGSGRHCGLGLMAGID